MTSSIQTLVRAADSLIARTYLALFQERNALLTFLFHSLFRNEQEISQNQIDPLERITVDHLRRFVEYYLENGYQFVGPSDLATGLAADGRYAMITFDDGYFNNALALEILEEYRVPALFFISTENVRQQKCFWWDVLYRERMAQGATERQIYGEGNSLKSKTTEQIESELTARFGPNAFAPRGPIDRPFTAEELRDFAAHPQVHLGNHTANHAILTNYTPEQIRAQIARAQTSLEEMTGRAPTVIAYPNGAHTLDILETCEELGLQIGFTVKPKKNSLPLSGQSSDHLRLGRFAPHGNSSIEGQCRTFRSDVLIYGAMRAGYLKLQRNPMGR